MNHKFVEFLFGIECMCVCVCVREHDHVKIMFPNRLPELKGYVEMSSAGSIRPSKSAGDVNVADLSEEQDVGIYVEPDRTAAAVLLQSE